MHNVNATGILSFIKELMAKMTERKIELELLGIIRLQHKIKFEIIREKTVFEDIDK